MAVPAARSLLINKPAPGSVLTDAKAVPDGIVSVIVAGTAGTASAALQVPQGRGPCGNRNRSSRDAEREFVPADDAAPRNFANLQRTLAGCSGVGIHRHGSVERVAPAAHARAGVRSNGCQRENVSRKRVPVPRVAELPTWKNTLQGEPPLAITAELLAVVSVLPMRKTKTALGSPAAFSVSVPVN